MQADLGFFQRLLPNTGEVLQLRGLQAEAKALAAEQVDQLEATLLSAAALAAEIANGGDAYAIGARELAARLSEELTAKAETLEAIMSRVNR